MPAASSFLMNPCRSFTSKPMWSSTRPLVGSAVVAVLANRICTPGMSATGAWLRRLGLAPNVFTYQAWLSGIAASGRKRWTCSCRIGTFCCLSSRISIFKPSRGDIGLIGPVVVARLHRHARGLPLGDGVLDVLHDEADMI